MGIINRLIYVATGKTDTERKQIASANMLIRKKAIAAALRERQTQETRIAIEREKLIANKKLKKMRQPKRIFNPGAGLQYFSDSLQSKNKGKYKII